jgi:hypothetical protein
LAAGSASTLVGVADEVDAALEEAALLEAELLDASVEESLEQAAALNTASALRPAAATALR